MYEKVSSNLNFVEREQDVLKYWKEEDIFKKSIELREGNPVFTFYDGPPTANGKPHIGHVLTRVIKDLVPRYRTMKGYKVLRKAGWDTHGLPVELEVEKLLGFDGKEQIEKYGLEPFIQKCKETVWKYKGMWEDFSAKVGFWADMDNPYVTYHNEYIESEWWALKQIWDKGLLYKGYRIVPYCARCGTPLSSQEVAQGYKDVKEKSVVVKFKIKNEENSYFLAWTTTPWTLPSNVALCVNPRENYVRVEFEGNSYILAEALVKSTFGENVELNFKESYLGKDLEFKEYEPLFKFVELKEKAYYVTCADFVTLTDGTGIVHIAPAFGEDDSQVGRKYNLPFLQLVDEHGHFLKEVGMWQDTFVKNTDPEIIKYLKMENKLFKTVEYEHSYPHCWRCDTPLLYYARDSWFIKMSEVKDRLVKNNSTINWMPESIGAKRFGDWIANAPDWGLSRDRYWGTPLPVWECECGHRHVIGSIKELKEMSPNCPENIELHRPFIDEVYIKCPKCSGTMKRVKPVIDCWFDSGAMPFAQWHYPFENKKIFDENYPADYISEAVDQTRGWFYSLLAISTLLFDNASFENVIVLGHVQDENGQKMSKSKGNAIDPFDALSKHGADAIRWYFCINSALWLPNRFYHEAVSEAQRKFMGTLWNTYAFYVLYANIDKFNPMEYKLDYNKLEVIDKWILSRLNTLTKFVDSNMEEYKITESAREIQEFVDELSNWYVRRSRERFWQKEMPQSKVNAYMTLHTCLVTLSKLCAPFVPFITEQIYQNLVVNIDKNAPKSVHLCDYPVAVEEYINTELEKNMDIVLKIVSQGRACRNTANIKNRQPVARMFVKAASEVSEMYKGIIEDELNVKEVIFTDEADKYSKYNLKPQLRTLGPKYGKLLGKISQYLQNANGHDVVNKFKNGEKVSFEVDGTFVELDENDVLVETQQSEGFVTESDKDTIVVLDTNLTPALIEEGFVNEIISKIQTMRKEAGFEVEDHIKFFYSDNVKIGEIIKNNLKLISDEILGDEVTEGSADGYSKEWNINGEKVNFTVKKR